MKKLERINYIQINNKTQIITPTQKGEVIFDVVNGVATFKFDSLNFYSQNNTIEISIGSLINSTLRAFKPTYTYVVPEDEIKI